MKRDSKGRFIKDSLAGTEVLVIMENWGDIYVCKDLLGEKAEIFCFGKDTTLYLKGMVVGDDYNKGISIVEINSGKELVCITPKQENYNFRIQTAIKQIKTGIFSFNKFRIHHKINNTAGNISTCPYK